MEFKDSICYKCFGCNLLELEDFDFVIICKNFIQAEETEEDKAEIKSVEVKKITPEEMGDILDDLKNKIIGGNK